MELVKLDPDHPGFRDAGYRERRNRIALLAEAHRTGGPIPTVTYTAAEQRVWAYVLRILEDLHREKACRELVELQRTFPLDRDRIPQLEDVSRQLAVLTGFRMEPVGGLVAPRVFFGALARRVFLSTQYVRHLSRPLYTPEPDVIHELVGHAATLAHPRIAALNQAIGKASLGSSTSELRRLERVYWYTLEFGVVDVDGELEAFGAGLLSSAGELENYERHARLRPWDLDAMAATHYDPSDLQEQLFVAPSFEALLDDVDAWLAQGRWRDSWPGNPAKGAPDTGIHISRSAR